MDGVSREVLHHESGGGHVGGILRLHVCARRAAVFLITSPTHMLLGTEGPVLGARRASPISFVVRSW